VGTVRTEGLRGSLVKTLVVTSNDPDQPTMQLTMRIKIAGSVQFLPRAGVTVNLRADVPEPARVLVRKDTDEQGTLEVSEVVTNVPWLKASARKLAAPESIPGLPASAAGDWVIEVSPQGDLPAGQSLQEVQFKTGLGREPVVKVPVTVFAPPLVTFGRPTLLLPAPAPGEAAEGAILTIVRADVDPMAIQVETSPPEIKAKLEETAPGLRKLRLKVSWLPSNHQSEGQITLKAAGQSFQLPVRILATGTQGS
jgi:hypothetical protein